MKYRTRAIRKPLKAEIQEVEDIFIHDLTVYEEEDTSTGLFDATGVEIHRMKENIGFVDFDED